MISKKIIQIASNTKYSGLRNYFTHKSTIKNSLCGDKIKIELITRNKKICSMRYETESCIFCQASASLLSKIIKKSNIETLQIDVNEINMSYKNKKIFLKKKYKPFRKLFQQKYNITHNAFEHIHIIFILRNLYTLYY